MKDILNRSSFKSQPSTTPDQPVTTKTAVSLKQRLKGIVGKAALATTSTALMVSILLGADLYLHRKHEVNLWGYRGPAVGQKQPGEKRIAVLGGSTAWGFGLGAAQSFPGQMQQRLADHFRSTGTPLINVLNLAYNSEGAYSFKYTLRDYDYLDYDVVLIYSGYNDLWQPNLFVVRHQSPIFIWTGYLPLLPALTVRKIETWFSKEDETIVFGSPGENDSETRRRLEQLNAPGASDTNSSPGNYREWAFYCEQVCEAADLALKRGKRVLIVTEPYINGKHVSQQLALEKALGQRFGDQVNLRYLNLGRSVDLQDKSLCWDGMHLTAEGNRRITEALTQPVLESLER